MERGLLFEPAVRLRVLPLILLASCGELPRDEVVRYAAVAAPCDGHRVSAVRVSGATADDVPQLAVLEGTLDEPARAERLAELAERSLRSRGYADAEVRLARRTGCGVELDVDVRLGAMYRIAEIAFRAADGFPASERLSVLEDALGTVNTVGGVYIEYRMQRALAELQRRYRDAGWLDARVGAPRVTYGADGAIAIEIAIDAGERFRIAAVRASGGGAGARDTVLQVLGLHAGEFYDGPRVRTAIARARRAVARRVELRTRFSVERPEIELEAVVEARP